MADIKKLEKIASQIRRDILRMVHAQQSGHPGGALGCADLFAALYFEVLNHDPKNFTIEGKNEDLFFLSNGHLSAVWYSALARSGYFEIEELKTFRKINSKLQGHPTTAEHLSGIRIASGSLGQGLSAAIGASIGKKMDGDKSLVYCLMGDGELQEGQIWEAAMFAPAKKIDNIIGIVDVNGKQIDGPTDKVLSLANLKDKFEAFGWLCLEADGNKMKELINTMNLAKNLTGRNKPIMILMKTEMGAGVDFMMGTHAWHGKAPNDEQLENALSQIEETLSDF